MNLWQFPLMACALLLSTSPSTQAQTQNSFKPGQGWPDSNGVHINAHGGGILLYDNIYYWFGEHKIEGDAGNRAQVGVHCYSSSDLYNWKDEGIVLHVSDDANSEIVKDCIIERPKVIYNGTTGIFVMWFHLEFKGKGYNTARSGVAISDRATGPYQYLGSTRSNPRIWAENAPEPDNKNQPPPNTYVRDHANGQMSRDMALFVDDDGTAYHIYSSEDNRTLQIAQLTDDYTKHNGRYVRSLVNGSNEAPAIFKHNRKYYLITSGCTMWSPNAARSFVADNIMGEWKSLGNPCRGTDQQNKTTFESQGTYILPVSGKPGACIFMADRWQPKNPIDGSYIWLPIQWEGDKPVLKWLDEWSLDFFER
ncbi:MAG: glycoside hydrolase family 43 protein [Verrucomicrobiales bacterium]|nr:glycoside hydrolase family 43 protein [Verrucomicrobiales bacterium]